VGIDSTRLLKSPKLLKPHPGAIHDAYFSTAPFFILSAERGVGNNSQFTKSHCC
jgi:hypothetical protein